MTRIVNQERLAEVRDAIQRCESSETIQKRLQAKWAAESPTGKASRRTVRKYLTRAYRELAAMEQEQRPQRRAKLVTQLEAQLEKAAAAEDLHAAAKFLTILQRIDAGPIQVHATLSPGGSTVAGAADLSRLDDAELAEFERLSAKVYGRELPPAAPMLAAAVEALPAGDDDDQGDDDDEETDHV